MIWKLLSEWSGCYDPYSSVTNGLKTSSTSIIKEIKHSNGIPYRGCRGVLICRHLRYYNPSTRPMRDTCIVYRIPRQGWINQLCHIWRLSRSGCFQPIKFPFINIWCSTTDALFLMLVYKAVATISWEDGEALLTCCDEWMMWPELRRFRWTQLDWEDTDREEPKLRSSRVAMFKHNMARNDLRNFLSWKQ